jgi:hypothetical protein
VTDRSRPTSSKHLQQCPQTGHQQQQPISFTAGRQPPALLAASTWNKGEEDEQQQLICNEADPKEAVADLKKGEPELFVLLVYFAGDWEMHRRYGREEKKETIPIY